MADKKTALVTGGAIRIGGEISLSLARAGFDIALHYNSSADDAQETAGEIADIGRKCSLYKADLADISKIAALVEGVNKENENLCLLVNNASVFESGSFLKTSEELFDSNFNVNLKAPFFLSQTFAKYCKKGQIINVLDSSISKNETPYFAYLLAKKSLYEFTRMAARELAPDIRVNAVAPGTTAISKNAGKEYLQNKKDNLPLKKLATVREIADIICFFAGQDNLTGQCIFADGGEELL